MFRAAAFPVPFSSADVSTATKTSSPQTSPSLPMLCEDGRPYFTDPVSGRRLCTCHLTPEGAAHAQTHSLHAPGSGVTMSGGLKSLGGGPPPPGSASVVGAPGVGMDGVGAAFYTPLLRGFAVRPERLAQCLAPSGPPMPFDPALAAHPYGLLYAGIDVNGLGMRKAATRETTGPLKAWLHEHRKNPYPTKAEKIMLAIITKMTLTQVSTWFANARRRLKKESRLYSGPDNDNDDHDDDLRQKDDDDLSRLDSDDTSGHHRGQCDSDEDINVDVSDVSDTEDSAITSPANTTTTTISNNTQNLSSPPTTTSHHHILPGNKHHHPHPHHPHHHHPSSFLSPSASSLSPFTPPPFHGQPHHPHHPLHNHPSFMPRPGPLVGVGGGDLALYRVGMGLGVGGIPVPPTSSLHPLDHPHHPLPSSATSPSSSSSMLSAAAAVVARSSSSSALPSNGSAQASNLSADSQEGRAASSSSSSSRAPAALLSNGGSPPLSSGSPPMLPLRSSKNSSSSSLGQGEGCSPPQHHHPLPLPPPPPPQPHSSSSSSAAIQGQPKPKIWSITEIIHQDSASAPSAGRDQVVVEDSSSRSSSSPTASPSSSSSSSSGKVFSPRDVSSSSAALVVSAANRSQGFSLTAAAAGSTQRPEFLTSSLAAATGHRLAPAAFRALVDAPEVRLASSSSRQASAFLVPVPGHHHHHRQGWGVVSGPLRLASGVCHVTEKTVGKGEGGGGQDGGMSPERDSSRGSPSGSEGSSSGGKGSPQTEALDLHTKREDREPRLVST